MLIFSSTNFTTSLFFTNILTKWKEYQLKYVSDS